MTAKGWSGRKVTTARAHWAPLVAAGSVECWRCQLPIDPRSTWHVGHLVDRALGGSDSITNTRPEHARCNTSAGGKLAAALRAGTKPARRTRDQLERAAAKRRDWTT